ncbi:MAG TPA: hypothetical protein ENK64_01500, partial [Flavobacteriales bacterium]|nr:hypothetical protein [Flavobacteriales bacterium]
MKHKIVLLLILLVSYINPVQAQYGEVLDVSDALQNALDVRTSAVKIVKDYLYRGLKVNYVSKENDENLSGGEFSLLKLEVYAQDHPELKGTVEKVAHQWKNLRALALQKPKKEKMQGLLKKLGVFLKDADDLIETIDES